MRFQPRTSRIHILSTLLLIGAIAAPAGAQNERSARRILHFTAGGNVTTVARFVDSHWEMKNASGNWHAFSEDAILRAPKVSDVMREMKKRSKWALDTDDLNKRVEFAQWMVGEGLVNEALKEADSILEREPHHHGTLEFLHGRTLIAIPSLDVPADERVAARKELYRWSANAPISAREIAIQELRKQEESEAVHAELLEGLSSFSVRSRAFSSHALGRLFPGQDVKRLLQHSVLDSSADVRRQSAQALGNAEQAELITPVVRALGSNNIRVRTQAAEALGYMGYPDAVEPLVNYIATAAAAGSGGNGRVSHAYIFHGKQRAYIQDFDVEVATFQAVADPQINVLIEGEVLEAGVSGIVEYSYSSESRAARGSLSRLTGAAPGYSGSAWRKWWNENKTDWASTSKPQ
ncbi:MAG: hypothetical protein ACI8X5_003022 [Planctomycetota bacterium]|jgi:hypothetical protein